ncbi:MAG: methionine biosynthesis protein MetW [Gammaproteobacteria bacterium]|nr:methionine biosynthesis protein MetW [Gammaproteobacteria bacterium]
MIRVDQEIIIPWMKEGSSVLDLGCGDGTLLRHLQESRNMHGYGLEIDQVKVISSIENGVNVIHADLDAGLNQYFDNDSFDYVIMTQTLQAIQRPDHLLQEMLRIGREGIVTFPNMGHWKSRLQLGLQGIMPVTRTLPYEWYNTPNIHLCTLQDFEALCERLNIRILQSRMVNFAQKSSTLIKLMPGLMGEIAVYHITRG